MDSPLRSLRLAPLSLLAVGFAGCGGVEDASRKICDGSAGVRLALQGMGGFIGPNEGLDIENGSWFLFVDGSCHYWVKSGDEVRTGVLDAAAEASLTERTAYRKWGSIDGDWSASPPPMDAGQRVFWDGVHHATCSGSCEAWGTPEALKQLDAALSDGLLRGLWDQADRFEGSAVRLLLLPASEMTPSYLFDWPLARAPEPFLYSSAGSPPEGTSFLLDGEDAVALRALRQEAQAQGKLLDGAVGLRLDEDRTALLLLREALPFEDENGLVRPPE